MPKADSGPDAGSRSRRLGWLLAAPLLVVGVLAAISLVVFLVNAVQRQGSGAELSWPDVSEISWPDFFYADITGPVVRVIDGDTLIVSADGRTHTVRLHGIDAPERGQPWGRQARSALAHKVRGRVVAVDVLDVDRYDRLVGLVRVGEHDVNKEMVQEGHAWVYRQYTWDVSLYLDEMNARSQKAGLWARNDPVAPWDWRQEH